MNSWILTLYRSFNWILIKSFAYSNTSPFKFALEHFKIALTGDFVTFRGAQVKWGNKHCVKSVQIQSYFWSVFSCIRTEYEDLRNKSPYSVRIQENTEQK